MGTLETRRGFSLARIFEPPPSASVAAKADGAPGSWREPTLSPKTGPDFSSPIYPHHAALDCRVLATVIFASGRARMAFRLDPYRIELVRRLQQGVVRSNANQPDLATENPI